jgi:hypothetical protein
MSRAFQRLLQPVFAPSPRHRRRSLTAVVVLTLSALAAPHGSPVLHAAPPAEGGDAEAPSHEQVLSMLRGGIDAGVILGWLDASGRPLPLPSAEQLLELKEAGATNDLLAALIERAEPRAPAEAPAAPSPPPTPPLSASGPGSPPPAAAAPVPTAAEGVLVRFELSHLPRLDDGEELDLFVYLDGKPLSYVPAGGSLFGGGEPLRFTQRLPPGVHRLRAAFEVHREAGGDRWRHEARFATDSLRFELAPGAPAAIRVEVRDDLLGAAELSYRFEQEERVAEIEDAGGDAERWPRLCEEIAADTTKKSERDRRWLEQGCVAWNDLWPEGGAPPRDEVREALEDFDFRPVPAGS